MFQATGTKVKGRGWPAREALRGSHGDVPARFRVLLRQQARSRVLATKTPSSPVGPRSLWMEGKNLAVGDLFQKVESIFLSSIMI